MPIEHDVVCVQLRLRLPPHYPKSSSVFWVGLRWEVCYLDDDSHLSFALMGGVGGGGMEQPQTSLGSPMSQFHRHPPPPWERSAGNAQERHRTLTHPHDQRHRRSKDDHCESPCSPRCIPSKPLHKPRPGSCHCPLRVSADTAPHMALSSLGSIVPE